MRTMLERSLGERRSHPRVPLSTTGLLEQGGAVVGRYAVQNLSAGDALLTGAHDVSRAAPLTLHLEIPDDGTVALDAQVLRAASVGGLVALAVAFERVDPSTEDRIQDAVLRALDRRHREAHPAMLVVEADPGARERLVAQLEALGHRAIGCAAPLDALVALADPSERVGAVLARGDAEPGASLLSWVAEHRPTVRPILVVEDRRSDPEVGHRRVTRCLADRLSEVLERAPV